MRGMLLLCALALGGCYQIVPGHDAKMVYRLNTLTGSIHACVYFWFEPRHFICRDGSNEPERKP